MIRFDMEQGSKQWLDVRLGIPTASQFSRILTPKTMKLSGSSSGYVYELLAETLIGTPVSADATLFMERGIELEESAVEYYEFQRDVETEKVGFCMTDDRKAGCSPDRLIGEDGCLEVKCPSAAVHVSYLLEGQSKYRAQTQGVLWVTGRRWIDVLSYHPDMPPALVREERDEKFIGLLEEAVEAFCERLQDGRRQLEAIGCFEQKLAS